MCLLVAKNEHRSTYMTDTITFNDFLKLDLRVGTILTVSVPEWSEKLLELRVDFGSEIGERTILAGIRKWYQPEQLEGKQSLFIVNLPARKMGEGVSEGMLLAADAQGADDKDEPVVLLFDSLAPAGSRLH